MTTTEPLYSIGNPDELSAMGVEHKHLYETPSGKKWLGKVHHTDAELDSYVVLKSVGLPTPDVGIRHIESDAECCPDEREVLIEWLDNAKPLGEVNPVGYTKKQYEQSLRIWMVDYVIGNYDRHEYNILYDTDGNLIPIDGGMTFNKKTVMFFNIGHLTTMLPIADLRWDSLTSMFSSVEVTLITNDVIQSIRSIIHHLHSEHQLYAEHRLKSLFKAVLGWYADVGRP